MGVPIVKLTQRSFWVEWTQNVRPILRRFHLNSGSFSFQLEFQIRNAKFRKCSASKIDMAAEARITAIEMGLIHAKNHSKKATTT